MLNGARQVGKSTLARDLVAEGRLAGYVTLDDLAVLDAARSDPEGFVGAQPGPLVIDEVQLEPRLFRAIKASVDRDRSPGRYLLTGSADLTVLPQASDALVGRMELHTLWPLSQGEIGGRRESFIDALFGDDVRWEAGELDRAGLAERICTGGFPEPVQRDEGDRPAWHRSYLETVVRRDVRDRVDIEHLAAMPRLVGLLAARSMTLVNLAEVARALALPTATVRRYVALLEAAMLVRLIPAFARDLAKRVVKSPKVAMVDTGLAAAVGNIDPSALLGDDSQLGRLAETFAVNEVQRQAGWSDAKVRLMHARTAAGREVDIVVEASDGRIAGVEVKAGRTVGSGDFAGLKTLRSAVGSRWVRGVVLHVGEQPVPFGEDLWAVPFDALWRS